MIIWAAVIFLSIIFLIISLIIIFTIKEDSNLSTQHTDLHFSILISAKNEEKNLPHLFEKLDKINYPITNFEVIIIDDNSSDNTFKTANDFAQNRSNYKVITAANKLLPGKKGALNIGIEQAANPYILVTDADCSPEPGWLEAYSLKFTEGYDFLFGPAPFIQKKALINNISCFENLRSFILTFTAAKAEMPYSATSRNFGFSKSAYQKIEGYKNTTETLSGDDDLLLREAVKNNLRIGAIFYRDAYVYSETKHSIREYIKQRSRHTKTSSYYLTSSKLLLGFWHLLNIFFLFSPLLIPISSYFVSLFVFKICTDIFVVSHVQEKLGYKFSLIQIIYLQCFYELFLILNFFSAKITKDTWT